MKTIKILRCLTVGMFVLFYGFVALAGIYVYTFYFEYIPEGVLPEIPLKYFYMVAMFLWLFATLEEYLYYKYKKKLPKGTRYISEYVRCKGCGHDRFEVVGDVDRHKEEDVLNDIYLNECVKCGLEVKIKTKEK